MIIYYSFLPSLFSTNASKRIFSAKAAEQATIAISVRTSFAMLMLLRITTVSLKEKYFLMYKVPTSYKAFVIV